VSYVADVRRWSSLYHEAARAYDKGDGDRGDSLVAEAKVIENRHDDLGGMDPMNDRAIAEAVDGHKEGQKPATQRRIAGQASAGTRSSSSRRRNAATAPRDTEQLLDEDRDDDRRHGGQGGESDAGGKRRGARATAGAAARRADRGLAGGTRRTRSRGRRAWQQTGVPGATRSATQLVLQVLGVIVGLSIAYVLLSDASRKPRGKSAIEIFGKGIVSGLQRVVLPVDPLASSSAVNRAKAKADLASLPNVPADMKAKIDAGIDVGDPSAKFPPLLPLSAFGGGPTSHVTPAHPRRAGARAGTVRRTAAHPGLTP